MVVPDKGKIFSTQEGPQIPNYAGIWFKSEIASTFRLLCEIENDINCVGLAESVFGEGIDSRITVCLVINGEIFHGFSSSAREVAYLYLFENIEIKFARNKNSGSMLRAFYNFKQRQNLRVKKIET